MNTHISPVTPSPETTPPTTQEMARIQRMLREDIPNRCNVEYMRPGASEGQRRYYDGRLSALLQALTEGPASVYAIAVKRYESEHFSPGDDVTIRGTPVRWLIGCIHAMQDVLQGSSQGYSDPVRP